MGPPRQVVEISSDDDEEGKLSLSPGPLGWVARLDDVLAPVPRKKKGKSAGFRVGRDADGKEDDCVILDGDPHRTAAVAGAKGRSAGGGVSDEVRIIAVKGEFSEPNNMYLPYDIDSEDLAQLFVFAGIVVFSEIIYDKATGQSCGYGFVTMRTVQEAEKAVELYHRREMDGIPMSVRKVAATRVARADTAPSPHRCPFKIYVANIPWRTNNASLKQLFSEYGQVVSAKVHHYGERRVGFVTMATQEASDHAIWYLNNQVWRGRTLRVRAA